MLIAVAVCLLSWLATAAARGRGGVLWLLTGQMRAFEQTAVSLQRHLRPNGPGVGITEVELGVCVMHEGRGPAWHTHANVTAILAAHDLLDALAFMHVVVVDPRDPALDADTLEAAFRRDPAALGGSCGSAEAVVAAMRAAPTNFSRALAQDPFAACKPQVAYGLFRMQAIVLSRCYDAVVAEERRRNTTYDYIVKSRLDVALFADALAPVAATVAHHRALTGPAGAAPRIYVTSMGGMRIKHASPRSNGGIHDTLFMLTRAAALPVFGMFLDRFLFFERPDLLCRNFAASAARAHLVDTCNRSYINPESFLYAVTMWRGIAVDESGVFSVPFALLARQPPGFPAAQSVQGCARYRSAAPQWQANGIDPDIYAVVPGKCHENCNLPRNVRCGFFFGRGA